MSREKPEVGVRRAFTANSSNSASLTAHNHIVKVSHHVVGVSQLPVQWSNGERDPCQARDQELKEKTDAEHHRRGELDPAAHIQLNIFIPVGTAIAIVESTKNVFAPALIPTVNM
jgi:hypothetical protein